MHGCVTMCVMQRGAKYARRGPTMMYEVCTSHAPFLRWCREWDSDCSCTFKVKLPMQCPLSHLAIVIFSYITWTLPIIMNVYLGMLCWSSWIKHHYTNWKANASDCYQSTLKYIHPLFEEPLSSLPFWEIILHTNNMHPPTHSQNM